MPSMLTKLLFLLLFVDISQANFTEIYNVFYAHNSRLHSTLFKSYIKELAPTFSLGAVNATENNEPIPISLDLNYFRVAKIDQVSQSAEVVISMQVYWVDRRLVWSPDEYGGIPYLLVKSDSIWQPSVSPCDASSRDNVDDDKTSMAKYLKQLLVTTYQRHPPSLVRQSTSLSPSASYRTSPSSPQSPFSSPPVSITSMFCCLNNKVGVITSEGVRENPQCSQPQSAPPAPVTAVSVEKSLPDYDVLVSWTKSFDNLLGDKTGQLYFKAFLKREYSDGNMLFWLAVEELKKGGHEEIIEEKARIIYEDFISVMSPKEVSLDGRVREIVNIKMERPNVTTFDEAQAEIYMLMLRDSYPRFIQSRFFNKMLAAHGQLEEV